jgi:hypothetical protein
MSDLTLASKSDAKSHVFISYSRRDGTPLADQLELDLAKHGIVAWRDKLIRPGVPFGPQLEKAIDNSFAMLALITDAACRSNWVRGEWCYAISRLDVTIIPLVAPNFDEKAFPIELFSLCRMYMTDGYDDTLDSVVAALRWAKDNPPLW